MSDDIVKVCIDQEEYSGYVEILRPTIEYSLDMQKKMAIKTDEAQIAAKDGNYTPGLELIDIAIEIYKERIKGASLSYKDGSLEISSIDQLCIAALDDRELQGTLLRVVMGKRIKKIQKKPD